MTDICCPQWLFDLGSSLWQILGVWGGRPQWGLYIVESTLGSDLSCTMASAGVRTCSSFLSNLLWSLWLDCWRHNDYQRAGVTWSRSDDDSVSLGESTLVVRLKSFTSFTLTMGHHHQHNKEPNSKSLEPEIQNIPNLQKSDEVRKPNHTKITKKY